MLKVIDKVRRAVGSSFPVGIKINSTDKLEGGLTEDDALEVVRLLDQTSVDLIDISGGTYFPGAKASSEGSSDGGPYFLEFARRAKGHCRLPRYVRGKRGEIVEDHGVWIFADTNASGRDQKPQHLYTVIFTHEELWGADASPRDTVVMTLYDDHMDHA